MLLFIINTRTK